MRVLIPSSPLYNIERKYMAKLTNEERVDKTIKDAIMIVQDNMVEGREKSLTITKLEEALLWSRASDLR